MRNAAREGNQKAVIKIEEIKKTDRKRVAKYYKLKQKSKRKKPRGTKRVRVRRKKTRM